MRADEVEVVADLHRSVFPTYPSSQLGRRFCCHLVDAYRLRPDAVVLVEDRGGPIPAGYLVGAPPAAHREVQDRLRRHAFLPSVSRGLSHPGELRGVAARVWALVRRGRSGSAADPPTATERSGDRPVPAVGPADERVVLIGVDRAARGTGAADELLSAFTEWARGRGARLADLGVEPSNAVARACYERNGWVADLGDPLGERYVLEL